MNRITLTVVVVEAVFAAVGLAGGWLTGMPILGSVRIDLPSGGLALAATVPLVALVFWGMSSESALFSRLKSQIREAVIPLFAKCSPLELLLISIAAGVCEEIFFRGFLQSWLGGVVDPWLALALVSILFGLVHYVSLGYAIVAALLGAYMGALWLLTGNLFVAMACHALYDFAAILFISRMPLSPAAEQGPASETVSSGP